MNTQPVGNDPVLNAVQAAIAAIKFGSVEIVIHDSKVVQIERKEKVRFNNNPVTDRTSGSSDISDTKRSQS